MRSAYVPEPMPDETLHSLVARYTRHMRATSPGEVARTVFGDRHAVATGDLPNRLGSLCAWLGPPWTPASAADALTLVPYYAAFHEARERDAAVARMAGNGGSVQFRLGVATWRLRPPAATRFCPACFESMVERHGEAWWRRSHQLPGVLVCPEHGDWLVDARWPRVGRHAFIAATPETCPAAPQNVPSGRLGEVMLDVARSSAALLRGGPTWDPSPDGYRARLAAADLMRSARKVDLARVHGAFLAHHGGALALVGGAVGVDLADAGWLTDMTRARRKAAHPLLHVLVDALLRGMGEGTPSFGVGPWRCENPLAGHCGAATIASVDRRRDHGKVTGRFACACGYTYTRRHSPDGTVGPPRLACYGPLLEPALRRLIVPGATLRGVAAAVGLDAKTMLREAAALGLSLPWTGRSVKAAALAAVPVAVRPRARAVRARPPRRSGPRLDWPTQDAVVAEAIRAAAAAVIAAEPPERVTLAAIERRLGRPGWLRKRVALLPAANAAVDAALENTGGYRIRRVRHAAAHAEPHAPAWRVLKAAGVSGRFAANTDEALTSWR